MASRSRALASRWAWTGEPVVDRGPRSAARSRRGAIARSTSSTNRSWICPPTRSSAPTWSMRMAAAIWRDAGPEPMPPPQVKPTGGGPTWYLQRKAPDLLDREGLQAGVVGTGHDGLAVDEFAPVAAPALPGSGAAGRRRRQRAPPSPGSTRSCLPAPERRRRLCGNDQPAAASVRRWLPSGSGSRPRPGLPTRRPGRPASGSSCPWPRTPAAAGPRRSGPGSSWGRSSTGGRPGSGGDGGG